MLSEVLGFILSASISTLHPNYYWGLVLPSSSSRLPQHSSSPSSFLSPPLLWALKYYFPFLFLFLFSYPFIVSPLFLYIFIRHTYLLSCLSLPLLLSSSPPLPLLPLCRFSPSLSLSLCSRPHSPTAASHMIFE